MKQMQSKGIDFKGQRIYIGIDVHLRSWSVTAIALPYYKVQSTIPPSATALRSFLDCRFPRGEYVPAGSTLPVTKAASPAFPRIIPLSPAG